MTLIYLFDRLAFNSLGNLKPKFYRHAIIICFGDKTFAVAATRVWNSFPADLWTAELSYTPGSDGRWRRPTTAHCELSLFHCTVQKYSFFLTFLLT